METGLTIICVAIGYIIGIIIQIFLFQYFHKDHF